VQSIVEIGHGHAVLEVKSTQAFMSRVNVREPVLHHTPKRILNSLLLESVLLVGLSRRGGFGDAAVGDNCASQH